MTDVVCIGRNIKTTPMEEIRWQKFISDLYESFVDVYFSGGGKGIYKEGCEDSYCIVGMLHPGANLADLAKKYEQESIAVVSAETKFVSAKKANG